MDLLQMLNVIETQFPDALPILGKPGVADVFVRYVNAQPPWTTAQLQAELRKTPYYQSTPQAVRDNDILKATDPATWGQKVEQAKRMIDDLERQLGVNLDKAGGLSSPAFAFLVQAAQYGWDMNEIRYRMLASVNATADGGALGAQAAQIKKMANDYGVPMADKDVMTFARQVLQGAVDAQGVQGYLIQQAKSMFPGIEADLDRGFTVRQIASPYLQLAAQELEIDPETINLTDQKWLAALNQVDPKTGQRHAMALDSWLAKIRTDPTYGYDTTAKGRADAAALVDNLSKMFGVAA